MNTQIKNIIIANDAEAYESIINTISNKQKRLEKIRKEHFLSSRFLFWEGDNKAVITPYKIDTNLINKTKSLGYKNIENLYPKKIDISLSKAIMKDKTLLSRLQKIISQNPGVTLSPYCFTKDFSDLIIFLRKKKLAFTADQEPTNNSVALVDYLGSKTGFRLEMQKLQKLGKYVPTPELFICKTKEEILEAVLQFYKNKKSSVIKSFSGEGGWGVQMVRIENFSLFTLRPSIKSLLQKDSIWSFGPYVVEELIQSKLTNQSSPSLEMFIDNDGPIITYICNQLVSSAGTFLGVLMGKDSLESKTIRKIKGIGKTIADHYFKLGYRGFFDIDFIISQNGIPYPIETNVRRTGGTHAFDLTRHLYGKAWLNRITVISADSFNYGPSVLPVKDILEKVSTILFPFKGKKMGIIIIAVDKSKPIFSFVVFAPNKIDAFQIYNKLTRIWKLDIL